MIIKEEEVRVAHSDSLREQGIDPYPSRVEPHISLEAARQHAIGESVSVVGRLISKREMGKISFSHLKDFSGKLQVVFSEKELGKDLYKTYAKFLDMGDFVAVMGEMFLTKAGEISILVKKYTILCKGLLPMPEKFHGLTDVEMRYRQRYLDLLSNEESMRIAVVRSRIVAELRRYFDDKGFMEVETPILQSLYGGANARPFVTHHNALDVDLFLRIAPELYLKRLLVGGFEKVYEIARCFRNEGIDQNHNPEFTQIEFYWAYANYTDLMNLMENLIPKLIVASGLSLQFESDGQAVDFTPPYPRVTMRDLIQQYAHFDIEDCPDQTSMYAMCQKLSIEGVDKNTGRGKMIDEIYKTYARPKIVNPIFMIDHPVELSPLAKKKFDNPNYVERVQLLCVGGNELCNGFSELNDPIDQENRFKEQERLSLAGDDESMPYDQDFVTALKHGMPPTAGLGMGIDRLVKLLTGAQNLKEVILFPTLRPQNLDQHD